MTQPRQFPARFDISRYTTLARARRQTLLWIERIEEHLAPLNARRGEVMTVALAGSLGRLEALSHSDCDLLVVTEQPLDSDGGHDEQAPVDAAWSLLQPLGFPRPEAGGIFSNSVSKSALVSTKALGSLSEAKSVFGKRMQLLLDCRPVFRNEGYSALSRSILNWYASGYLEHDGGKQWTYLLNDLSRYLHSYSAWKQFDFGDGATESWYTLQLKLRTSRLLAFAGLLLLLGHSSNNKENNIGWLHEHLQLSPLERIALVFQAHDDRGFERIAGAHDEFMSAMDDGVTRERLITKAPRGVAELGGRFDPAYLHLHEVTSAIAAELTRFTLDRRRDWHPRFFQYLIF